jgi:hypothetical protein
MARMWLLTHITAVSLTLIFSALAVITIVYAYRVATWDRRHPPAEPAPPAGDDPRPRPACPWCDTHACIDRTMCNCTAACGSWLCEAPAAPDPVDAEIEQWLKDGDHRG